MSAFVLGKKHFDRMVATMTLGPSDKHGPWELHRWVELNNPGQVLIDENIKSIEARYPDCVDHPENVPGPNDRFWLIPDRYQPRPNDRPFFKRLLNTRRAILSSSGDKSAQMLSNHLMSWLTAVLLIWLVGL